MIPLRLTQVWTDGLFGVNGDEDEAENSGDLYVLVRFIGEEGELACKRIAYSGYSPDLLLRANLSIENPDK